MQSLALAVVVPVTSMSTAFSALLTTQAPLFECAIVIVDWCRLSQPRSNRKNGVSQLVQDRVSYPFLLLWIEEELQKIRVYHPGAWSVVKKMTGICVRFPQVLIFYLWETQEHKHNLAQKQVK